MRVPFLDLSMSGSNELTLILDSIKKVLEHGRLVMGSEVAEFEEKIARYCNRKYAVGMGSGTDALYLGLRALDIGEGDEVITTSLSWVATANAIALTGATPVFADILDDLNIAPLSVESLITSKTKAILVVDYTGRIGDMEELSRIAEKNNLLLVEDGSQAFGAVYQGQKCGSFGVVSAISHNPMKVLAACGEAGSVLCNDSQIYDRLVSLRYNGTVNKEICIEPSLNGKIDTLQAAILLERLELLEDLLRKRRENARFYDDELHGYVTTPKKTSDRCDAYYTYTIQTPRRDELKLHLEKFGIETKIQHPILMPEQPAYRYCTVSSHSNASAIVKQILCIPVHEKLSDDQKNFVVEKVQDFSW